MEIFSRGYYDLTFIEFLPWLQNEYTVETVEVVKLLRRAGGLDWNGHSGGAKT